MFFKHSQVCVFGPLHLKFKDKNPCRMPLPFSDLKRICCRLVPPVVCACPTDEEQQSHPSAIMKRRILAQDLLQNPCLGSPLLFTSPEDCQESSHCHLGKKWGQVSVPLCFLGAARSVGSGLVKLKACSSSPAFVEPINNIRSRNNMSSPPQVCLHYSPCFFNSIPTLKN